MVLGAERQQGSYVLCLLFGHGAADWLATGASYQLHGNGIANEVADPRRCSCCVWNATVKESDAAGFRVNRLYDVFSLLIIEYGFASPIKAPFRIGVVKNGTKTFRIVIAMNGRAIAEVVSVHIHALYIETALGNVVIDYGRELVERFDGCQALFRDMRDPEAEGIPRIRLLTELVGGLMNALKDSLYQLRRYEVIVDLELHVSTARSRTDSYPEGRTCHDLRGKAH